MEITPIFTSTFSIGRSILNLDSPKDVKKNGERYPRSIVDICLKNGVKDLFLLENNFGGFVTAYKTCLENKIVLHPGLKLTFCSDLFDKSKESKETEHNLIIWLNKSSGYEKFIQIYSHAATVGFFEEGGKPRMDLNELSKFWNDDELSLSIPFYGNFISNNLLRGHRCMPNFFTKPNIFIEHNDLPFNYLIKDGLDKWNQANGCEVNNAKSIYYEQEKDFIYYSGFRCLHNRSCLNDPKVEELASNQFSFESYLKLKEENL